MTGPELRNLFNVQYNNIFNQSSPGLNDYEISLYLTKALKELVQSYYTGQLDGNPIDSSEESRELLAFYTKEKNYTDLTSLEGKFLCYETNIIIEDNLWYVLNEFDYDGNKWIKIKPIPFDKINGLLNNPYKAPTLYRSYRVEYYVNDKIQFRIYSKLPVKIYNMTYLETPSVVIIDDLNKIVQGLTIEGKNSITIPQYPNPWIWTLIINRAVELATRDYKENTLTSQVQLNSRVQ